jgi:hypothetical protein
MDPRESRRANSRDDIGYKPMRYMEFEVVIRKLDKQTLKLYSVSRAEVEES